MPNHDTRLPPPPPPDYPDDDDMTDLSHQPLIIAIICGLAFLGVALLLLVAYAVCRRHARSQNTHTNVHCGHCEYANRGHNPWPHPPPPYYPPDVYHRPDSHCACQAQIATETHSHMQRHPPTLFSTHHNMQNEIHRQTLPPDDNNAFPLLNVPTRATDNPVFDGEVDDTEQLSVVSSDRLADLYKLTERSFSQTVCGKLLVSVARYVDHHGDTLILDNMGISLRVPEGAIKRGQRQLITLVLNWDLSDNPQMSKEHSLVSPVVYVGPHGLKLKKPCVLSFRHCSFDTRHIRVMRSETELTDIKNWQTLCDRENRSGECYLTQDECQLQIDKFTLYTCVQTPVDEQIGKKWLQIAVFACPLRREINHHQIDKFTLYTCVQTPVDEQIGKKWLQIAVFACPLRREINHHQIRVYFLNKTPCALQWAIQNEAGFGGKLVCPEKVFLFDGREYDMFAKTRYISDGWELVDTDGIDKISFLGIWHGQCPHVSVCYRRAVTQHAQNNGQRQRHSNDHTQTATVAIEMSLHLLTYQSCLEDQGEKIFIQVAEDNVTPVTESEREVHEKIEITINNILTQNMRASKESTASVSQKYEPATTETAGTSQPVQTTSQVVKTTSHMTQNGDSLRIGPSLVSHSSSNTRDNRTSHGSRVEGRSNANDAPQTRPTSPKIKTAGSFNINGELDSVVTSQRIQVNINNVGCQEEFSALTDQTRTRTVPHELRHQLVVLLDPHKRVSGNDWRQLASKLDLDACIPKLETYESPTEQLLNVVESRGVSIEELKGMFRSMSREDCVQTIDAYMRSGESDREPDSSLSREPVESSYSGYQTHQGQTGNQRHVSSQMSLGSDNSRSANVGRMYDSTTTTTKNVSGASGTLYSRNGNHVIYNSATNTTDQNWSFRQRSVTDDVTSDVSLTKRKHAADTGYDSAVWSAGSRNHVTRTEMNNLSHPGQRHVPSKVARPK